jgi:hypothetical protein
VNSPRVRLRPAARQLRDADILRLGADKRAFTGASPRSEGDPKPSSGENGRLSKEGRPGAPFSLVESAEAGTDIGQPARLAEKPGAPPESCGRAEVRPWRRTNATSSSTTCSTGCARPRSRSKRHPQDHHQREQRQARDWPLPEDHLGPLHDVSKKGRLVLRCRREVRPTSLRAMWRVRCRAPWKREPGILRRLLGAAAGLQAQESRANLLVSSLSNRLCLTKRPASTIASLPQNAHRTGGSSWPQALLTV